jgi:hypothetical protein
MNKQIIQAAKQMDWMQIVLHQGEPCFHLCDDGRFCGRARTWSGHNDIHTFVALADLLTRPRQDDPSDEQIAREAWEKMCAKTVFDGPNQWRTKTGQSIILAAIKKARGE